MDILKGTDLFMWVILGAALLGMALDFLKNRTNLLDDIHLPEKSEEQDNINSDNTDNNIE